MATFRNGSTDSMCLHSYLTTISFECNPHNVWEINGANVVDVTAYVIELSYFYYACNVSNNVQSSSVLIVKCC